MEDKKLIEAVKILDPRIKMPSHVTVSRHIKALFDKKKEVTQKEFEEVKYFAETNDAGSSSSGKSFVDINVYWVTEDFYPKKISDVLEMEESKNAENYMQRVKETEEAFNITEKAF